MASNIQENLPVAFGMLEKVPDKLRCQSAISSSEFHVSG